MSINHRTLFEGSLECDHRGCPVKYHAIVGGGDSPFNQAAHVGWMQFFPASDLGPDPRPIGVAYVLCPLHAIKIEGRS